MNPQDLLTQLRNLDAPAELSWWPPALGWWVLASLILAGLIALVWISLRNYHQGAAARDAKHSIEQAHKSYLGREPSAASRATFLQEVNAILKRLAAKYEGSEEVAGLTGMAWRSYLAEIAPELNATELEPFVSAIYEAQPHIDVDEVLFSLDILVNQIRRTGHA